MRGNVKRLTKISDEVRQGIIDPKCPESDVICGGCRLQVTRSTMAIPSSSQTSSVTSASSQASSPPVQTSTTLKRGSNRPIDSHSNDPSPIRKVGKSVQVDIATSSSSSSTASNPLESTFNSTLEIEEEEEESTVVMNIPFQASGVSGSSCVCCRAPENLTRISEKAKRDAFRRAHVWIKKCARACKKHLFGDVLELEAIRSIEIRSETVNLEHEEFLSFIDGLTSNMEVSFLDRFKNVKELGISDEECKAFTGFSKAIFKDIVHSLKSMRNTEYRTVSQAVAIYLTRLHNGHVLSFLCKMFARELEWHTVRNWCNEVEKAFERDIIPNYLGPLSVSSRGVIVHITLSYITCYEKGPYILRTYTFEIGVMETAAPPTFGPIL